MICGSSIAFRSPPKAAARASGVGPLVGLQAACGGISAAITSAAVFSRGRVTASAAIRGDAGVGVGVDLQRLVGAVSAPDWSSRRTECSKRVVGLFGLDLFAWQVGGGHIRAGMAVKPDGAQMQEGGLAAGADKSGGLGATR